MSALYSPTLLVPNTRANAESVNGNLAQIAAAFDQIEAALASLAVGTGLPSYSWRAYADSLDGTANFTTGSPGNRSFVGTALNKTVPAPSQFPADYEWARFRGADGTDGVDGDGRDGTDGADGKDGTSRDFRFIRSDAQPATPLAAEPAGWSTSLPGGTAPLWLTVATKRADGALLSAWSKPVRLSAYNPRGSYDPTVTYFQGDTVTLQGGTYFLRVEQSQGTAPTGTAQANAYWDVVAAPGGAGTPATPPNAFSATIDLAASSAGVNLRSAADAAGYTGMSDATITFRVPAGVLVQGLANGGHAIETGTWPTSSYAIGLSLQVQGGGKVLGGGGRGGDGGSGGQGAAGGSGGDAIFCAAPISITVSATGEVRAAGGGGGSGAGTATGFPEPTYSGGGGGGGGYPNGSGGTGGTGDNAFDPAPDGQPGSQSGGGLGGSGAGRGGNAAAAGAAGGGVNGGAAGFAIRKNGQTVPVTNNGTIEGAVQ